jgi:hypothetical protein
MGAAHLAGGTATIETRLGALDDHVTIRIENETILDTDFVVHFPIAMRQAWDNVIFTCSITAVVPRRHTGHGVERGEGTSEG